MPELPEVETIVNGLKSKISGKEIVGFEVLLPKTLWLDEIRATGEVEVNQAKSLVEGKKVESITRRAKMIIANLSGEAALLMHLKMTGQLIYIDVNQQRFTGGHPSDDMGKELPVKSTRAIFTFEDGSKLYFNDQRQFGYIKIIPYAQLNHHKTYLSYGPEPLTSEFSADYLYTKAQSRPKITIKQLILDQQVVAGIGNIYADESLFETKINPATKAASLSVSDMGMLIKNIKEILEFSIQRNGTSSEHYVTASGEKGDMQNFLKVYRKTGQSCPVCGHQIERTVIGGRGTHFCPNCQK